MALTELTKYFIPKSFDHIGFSISSGESLSGQTVASSRLKNESESVRAEAKIFFASVT